MEGSICISPTENSGVGRISGKGVLNMRAQSMRAKFDHTPLIEYEHTRMLAQHTCLLSKLEYDQRLVATNSFQRFMVKR